MKLCYVVYFAPLFLLCASYSQWVLGDTATTTVSESSGLYNQEFKKIDEFLHNKEFSDDNKITDLKLRAQAGSLSQYSILASMTLQGPAVGDLGATEIPNPDQRVGNYSQKMMGNVGLRYRFDSDQSLSFGTGLTLLHPLQSVDRVDVSTPYISYTMANRIHDYQILFSPVVSATTTPENQAVGQVANLSVSVSTVKNISDSRFSAALEFRVGGIFYSRGYEAPQGTLTTSSRHRRFQASTYSVANGDGNANVYNLILGPGLKYHLTDRCDLLASFQIPWVNPMSVENISVLNPNSPTANLGFGWAYNRDIYIGPSLQTYPTILTTDTTSISVSMLVSLL